MADLLQKEPANRDGGTEIAERGLSLEDFLNVRIQRLASKMSLITTREVLVEADITVGEWRIIARLHEHGPLSLTTLSRRIGMDIGPVSRLTTKAERKGLVLRRENPRDRRSSLFEMTEKSKRFHAIIWPKACDVAVSFNQLFSDAELETLSVLLDRAIHHANDRLGLD